MANPECSKCGNTDEEKFTWRGSGDHEGERRFVCKKCGKWGSTYRVTADKQDCSYSYSNSGNIAEYIVTTEKRIVTQEDIIELIHLDINEWQVIQFQVGTYEGYRKDRHVDWEVEDGVTIHGEVHDTGKMLVVPLHKVKVTVRRKTQEIRNNLVITDLREDLKKFAPRYPKINYPKLKDGMLFEITAFDLHIGKMTWAEESGENSNLKTQTKRVLLSTDELLAFAKQYPIEKILLAFGGDFFNSDNKNDTTTAGTAMQEDTRWQKTFRAGRTLAVEMIDRCATIAPVDVIQLSGNHDETRAWMLGDALEAWYHNCPNVKIDNSAKSRKYYLYGKNLIGFAHGNEEKYNRLANLMAAEVPQLWAQSQYREFHVGHLHHREDMFWKSTENDGIMVRLLRSLTPVDSWHYRKGFTTALQAGEAFLWHPKRGPIAEFTSIAERNPD